MRTPITESMRATTRSDRPGTDGEDQALAAGVAITLAALLLLGLGLFALTLPRLLGAVSALPARSVLSEIRNDQTVSRERIEIAAAALQQSRQWSGTPATALSDLALLDLLRVHSSQDSELRAHPLLPGIIEAQEMAVAKAPASGNGWARLADARYLQEGLGPATRDALEMSLISGGIDLPLLRFRLHLLLLDWALPAVTFAPAVREQVHTFTRYGKAGYDELVELSLVTPRGELIPAVLAETPDKHAYFIHRVERRRGRR